MAPTSNTNDIQRRLSFARIDKTAVADLHIAWKAIEPELGPILKRFYEHVSSEPELARLVGSRGANLAEAQKRHWGRVFSGRFDEDYARSVTEIGMAHHRIGLEPRWYIGAYQFVLNEIVMLLASRSRFRTGELARTITAVNKAVMLDMDFAISVYQDVLLAERSRQAAHVAAQVEAFRGTSSAMLEQVGNKSRCLLATADELTSIAGGARVQATSAAAAAEETSATVASVAGASEELNGLDQRDRPPDLGGDRHRRAGQRDDRPHGRLDRRAGALRREDRRRRRADPGDRGADQSPCSQCHDRSGARR